MQHTKPRPSAPDGSRTDTPRRVERRFCGERRPQELVRDLMRAHPQ